MSISKSFHAHYQSLKCKHVKTVPTALDTFNGGKAVCLQCVQCGKGIREIRKSKSGFNISELPPFDHELKKQQRQQRSELRTQMWNSWLSTL